MNHIFTKWYIKRDRGAQNLSFILEIQVPYMKPKIVSKNKILKVLLKDVTISGLPGTRWKDEFLIVKLTVFCVPQLV